MFLKISALVSEYKTRIINLLTYKAGMHFLEVAEGVHPLALFRGGVVAVVFLNKAKRYKIQIKIFKL